MANRDLDSLLDRNGGSVSRQRESLRTNPLLRHRAFLSVGGACDTSLRGRRDSTWSERLEPNRDGNSDRSDRSRLRASVAVWEISGRVSRPLFDAAVAIQKLLRCPKRRLMKFLGTPQQAKVHPELPAQRFGI